MITHILLSFFLINSGFGILFLVSEYTYIKIKPGKNAIFNELFRKSVHLSSALLFFISTYYLSQLFFITLCIESLVVFFVTKYLHIFKAAHATRKESHNWGIYLYSGGLIFVGMLFYSQIDTIRLAILILGLSDTLASIIGKQYPLKLYTLVEDNKSIGGSIAFFITTYILCIFFQHSLALTIPFLLPLLFAFNMTVIEAASLYGTDNIGILVGTPLLFSSIELNIILTIVNICFISVQYGKHNNHNKRSGENI